MVGSAETDSPSCADPASRSFDRPKSRSFAPDFVNITLPGLRSRWITSWQWAVSSASAISLA
jgi:hypothetical protein